jgi:photosystem II stability/assembly factor-like uncharacterized protein
MRAMLLALLLILAETATPQNWRRVEGTEDNIFSIAVNPLNKNSIWFGGIRKIFVSFDGGRTTGRVIDDLPFNNTGVITAVFIHPHDTTLILAGGRGCWQSRDNGKTWRHALPDTNVLFNGEAIACEPRQPDTLYIAPFLNTQDSSRIFFRSFDRGVSWHAIPVELDLSNWGFCSLSAGPGVLLGGTGRRGQVLRSTNYGEGWTPVYTSSFSLVEVPKITFDKQNFDTIWATVFNLGPEDDGVVLKSTTGGLSWNTMTLPGAPWAVETDKQGRIYVGILGNGLPGAYVTFDGGSNWQNYRSGLPEPSGKGGVWMIKSNGDPFGIFMADGERGAFKLQNFEIVNVEAKTPLPRRFELAQNFPNPFNPETVIHYTLFENSTVEIVIHDGRGQLIRRLVERFETAGQKSVAWDGKDQNGTRVSSGVYVYSLRAGNDKASKKTLLMR